jgi:hypothetical protein
MVAEVVVRLLVAAEPAILAQVVVQAGVVLEAQEELELAALVTLRQLLRRKEVQEVMGQLLEI